MKQILLSIATIAAIGSISFGLSSAFFSDTETSQANSLTAGSFDLLLNGGNNTSAIVNINDLKPGDNQIVEKSLRIEDNSGYVFMHIKDLLPSQGTQTEPEILEENGTPKFDIQNYIKYDLEANNQTIISLDNQVFLPEVVSCWIPLGELSGQTNVSVKQSFHLDPNVTNWAQGDTLSFVEEFYSVQSRNNSNPAPPVSLTGRIWDKNIKKCVNCPSGILFADGVDSANTKQGTLKNGNPITDPNRTNPLNATGPNNWVNGTGTNFFSLGKGGYITLTFSSPIVNEPGSDLTFYEATNGRATYPEEKADVYVSFDGASYFFIGTVTSEPGPGGDGIMDLDIAPSGLPSIKYVRLIDTTNFTPHANNADGYDIDAVKAKSACLKQ
ncbi:MAG: CalY family protein [Patescibacteria group bacterium]|nr:CalY family protein [Patescibacteria group bacterium]